MKRWLAFWVAVLVLGCGAPKDPETEPADAGFADAMHRLCHVDELAGLDAAEDPITIDSARYDWTLANAGHPDVIELVTLMRVEAAQERARMLERAARQARIDECPLRDSYLAEQ